MRPFLYTLIALLCLSCAKTDEQQTEQGSDKVKFKVAVAPQEMPTRGTPLDGEENLQNFYTWAYTYPATKSWGEADLNPTKVLNMEEVKRNSTTGIYAAAKTVAWLNDNKITAFSAGLMNPTAKLDPGTWWNYGIAPNYDNLAPKLSYQTPVDVTKQPDLVVARAIDQTNGGTGNLETKFQHALATVSFYGYAPYLNIKVASIKIINLVASGTLDLNDNTWTLAPKNTWTSYAAGINSDILLPHTKNELNELMNGDGHLMLIPQTLSGTVVRVTLENGIELDHQVPDTELVAGKKYVLRFGVGGITTYYEEYQGGDIGLYFFDGKDNEVNTLKDMQIVEAGYGVLSTNQISERTIKWQDRQLTHVNPNPSTIVYSNSRDKYYLFRVSQTRADDKAFLPQDVSDVNYGKNKPMPVYIDDLMCEGYCLPHFAKGVYTDQKEVKTHFIRTPQQMRNISFNTNELRGISPNQTNYSSDANYTLEKDLNFNDFTISPKVEDATTINTAVVAGVFFGEFIGNYHIITNVKVEYNGSVNSSFETVNRILVGGLFAFAVRGSLSNFTFGSATDNSSVVNTATTDDQCMVGGIVGFCAAAATGLTNYATVTDSYDYSVGWPMWRSAGGIAGGLGWGVTLSMCENRGSVGGSPMYAAGVVGRMAVSETISHCKNYGNITTSFDPLPRVSTQVVGALGGICAGFVGQGINDCQNYGTISSTTSWQVGGIVGYNDGSNYQSAKVTKCVNYGNVSGANLVGGIAGVNNRLIEKCASYENTVSSEINNTATLTDYAVGGICGLNTDYISDVLYVHSSGTKQISRVSTTVKIGGIVGQSTPYKNTAGEEVDGSAVVRAVFLGVAPSDATFIFPICGAYDRPSKLKDGISENNSIGNNGYTFWNTAYLSGTAYNSGTLYDGSLDYPAGKTVDKSIEAKPTANFAISIRLWSTAWANWSISISGNYPVLNGIAEPPSFP